MFSAIFGWWIFGLTFTKVSKQIDSVNLRFASMCIAKMVGEAQCYDGINQLTDMKFKLSINQGKKDNNKEIQNELIDFVNHYGVK